MSNYILILIWIAFAAFISQIADVQRIEVVCGKNVRRIDPKWAFLAILPLIIWTGYRDSYIGDTYSYIKMFREMPEQFSGLSSYMNDVTKDKGFYFLSTVIKCIVGNSENIYFLILAFIQAGLLFKVYRKYSTHYFISFFLFIASTDYISWMFNGIRQFLAVTITFACFELILKKKYVPAICFILLASLIHGTALLVIPFIFIAQGKAWNKKTLLFMAAVICVVTFTDRFTDLLDFMLTDTQYTNVVSDWQNWEDDGTNVLRVLVYAIPALLSLIGKQYIDETDDSCIHLCTNMSIAAAGLYVISMFTSGLFMGRLPIYFSLYSYILLPWEIDNLFTRESKKVVWMGLICCYLIFYYYQLHVIWEFV